MVGILDAIQELQTIKGTSDQETHLNIKIVIDIMEGSHRQWPSSSLCKIVFQMKPLDKQLFLDVLKDMELGLDEYLNGGE